MAPAPQPTSLIFQAAVERPLSTVFCHANGTWEGHDYRVEAIVERPGLDAFDVVMDFRDLEAALDAQLAPMAGRLLSELGMKDPSELAQRLFRNLAPHVPGPAHLTEVTLTDGAGRKVAVRAESA